MINITRSNEHYQNKTDWLDTTHHFSFAEYLDPNKMNFGPLRVFNDDLVQPGTGFDFHSHHDMEIVTYVIDGTLEHKDNIGNKGIIEPGEVQTMTAGSGITHSEYNHSTKNPLRLLQIWIFANKKGLAPSWEQRKFTKEQRLNKFLPIVVPENSKIDALHIHQDVSFHISSLTEGIQIKHELKPGRKAYAFVIDGNMKINDNIMQTRDAAKVENENILLVKATKPTELLFIDLPEKYAINQ